MTRVPKTLPKPCVSGQHNPTRYRYRAGGRWRRSLSLIPGTWRRVFYEDLPYAGEFLPAALEMALRSRGMDIDTMVDIDAAVIRRNIAP